MGSLVKIYALTISTSVTKIPENPNRKALLIQNNSANLLYILSEGSDTAQAVILRQDEIYTNDTQPQGEYVLIASAVSTNIRVEEDICRK